MANWEFVPNLSPFAHQSRALDLSKRKRAFALLMEQGTGKSKVLIDNSAILYYADVINCLLVIAPNEVHKQWINEQVPLHMPHDIRLRAIAWDARKRTRDAVKDLIQKPLPNHLVVFTINYEALTTQDGHEAVRKLLMTYRTCLALDEAHYIKTPSATRTMRIQKLAKLAIVRRILTGTPSTQSPFDLYSQFRFLDSRILGFDDFLTFKHHYGVFSKEAITATDKKGRRVVRQYETLQEYARLDELSKRIAPYSFRVLKKDCLDLPPKIYITRPVPLSREQRDLYNEVRDETLILLERQKLGRLAALPDDIEELASRIADPQDRMSFKIKLTQSMRLQQILGGFITDDLKLVRAINDVCPRMEATIDMIEQAQGKVIVWAQFRPEIEKLAQLLNNKRIRTVTLYGGLSPKDRTDNLTAFKDDTSRTRVLVAHPLSGGVGLNLAVAQTMIYYSNGYSVAQRLQSEDRAHRIGMKGALTICDMMAGEVPLDKTIRDTHALGVDLANRVLTATDEDFRRMI